MAAHTNDLRLKEIVTGQEDGTWGDSTNTNFDLIGDAFGYGTKEIAADANETFTVPDFSADDIRSTYIKFTSAVSLTDTRTVTYAPNTVSRVLYIENATSGGQSITVKQGSGSTVTIANGTTAVVYTDGAGSGASVGEVGVLTDADINSTVQAQGDVLDDLNTLGAVAADSEFLVGTGAGAFAWESGATVRTSLGVDPAGTDNSTDVTLAGAYDYLTLSGQEITLTQIDLTTDVTGDLPFSNIAQSSAANRLLGRGSAGGAGDFQEITLGSNLTLTGTELDAVAGGTGDVTAGTQAENQIAVWTNTANEVEGDAGLTYDGTNFNLATAKNFQIAGATILADAAGTTTLSNIDALDATTTATFEAAMESNIDTLNSLTSASSLATVGTITSGTWQGDTIADGYLPSSLDGKTLTNSVLTQPTLTLTQSASPTPTAEGRVEWDTDDNKIKIGTGITTLTFSDDAYNAATYQAAGSYLTDITGESIDDLSDVEYGTPAKGDILVYNGSDYTKLAVGTNNLVLTADSTESTGLKWASSSGGGDVTKVGTPVDTQIGVWTGDGTIEGGANFTFDSLNSILALAGSSGTSAISLGGANIIVDSPRGTATLSNIDALDSTTESTIENALDQLPNLTQTGTVTSGTWASSISSSATITLSQATNPVPTSEGVIQWDTNDNRIAVGDGSGTQTFSNDVANAAAYQETLSGATLTNVDPASDDEILIQDTSDSNNLKTVTASDLMGLANANFDTFTTAGADTWTKPDGINFVYVELWGAGAGGGNRTTAGSENGGGGGAFVAKLFPASVFSGDQDLTVGAGGAGHANGSTGNGTDGGDTTFGDGVVIIALGGLATGAGAGGYVNIGANDWNVCGGGGNGAVGGSSAHGGAGGGGPTASVSLSGGVSTFGGAGGDGIHTAATPGEDGTAPGGGGGGSSNDGGGGDGADGKINVWSW